MSGVKDKLMDRRGTTLVELTVAVAIMAAVFAAILPLFAGVRNSAETQWANLEMVQNARVLNEQLCRCLATASRVVAISSSTSDDGHIEFEAANGTVYRCDLGSGGYVEFGPAGDLSELVGPVEYLRFVGYDCNDVDNPTQMADQIRLVTWEAGLQNAGALTRDRVVRGACYLRAAPSSEGGQGDSATYDFTRSQAGEDGFAFASQGKPQVPTELGTPAVLVASDQYSAIAADDQQSLIVEVSDESRYAQLRVTFQIDQEPETLTSLIATWCGSGVNAHSARTDGETLYLWNYESSNYELVQASSDTDTQVTLSGSASGAPSAYVGGGGGRTVVLLVVSNDKKTGQKSNTLSTDYVKLDVVTSVQEGAVLP